MKITLDFTTSLEENASDYFAKAKKAKEKTTKVEAVIKKFEKEQQQALNQTQQTTSKIKHISTTKKYWYDSFKWTISSEGFLIVAARDATSNEILVKKHTADDDIVFHTDMAGSPFVIIKKNQEDVHRILNTKQHPLQDTIGKQTLQEAANFTAVHSKSWKMGLGTTKVFWVTPQQVSKEAQSGEYMAKGSFMIRGKTNYIDPQMDFCVGVVEEKYALTQQFLLTGPHSIVQTYCSTYRVVLQGTQKTSLVAKELRSFFTTHENISLPVDDLVAALPSGGCRLEKRRKTKEEVQQAKKKKQ